MAADQSDGYLDLYHRTSPESAEKIMRDRAMLSKENTAEVYLSTRPDGQAEGYGRAVVALRVPEELAELEDEFPDGEQHYRVRLDALRPEHFISTWTDEPATTRDDSGDPRQAVAGAEASLDDDRQDRRDEDAQADLQTRTSDAATLEQLVEDGPDRPVTAEPVSPQIDLDLGEAIYRQTAQRGGFTPEGVAAAEATIEQALTSRQAASTAHRLNALAYQVDAARDLRSAAPAVSGVAPPAPTAPPPPAARAPRLAGDVARARAAAAQIWDDTRDGYGPPTQTQRR